MSNYIGAIRNIGMIGGAVRTTGIRGTVMHKVWIMHGSRSTVKQGLDLKNYNFVRFERIPKERILNRFKNLGGNIQY